MDFAYLFTSFEGRISRQPYWIGIVVFIVVAIVATLLLGLLLGFVGPAATLAGFVLQLALVYPSAALMAKRLHDRDRPTWWVAFMLVPTLLQGLMSAAGIIDPQDPGVLGHLMNLIIFGVAVWFLIELGILRGTVGPNRYGDDPLEAPQH